MARRETTHRERMAMVEAKLNGLSLKQVAHQAGVHRDTARYWWRQYRDHGWSALLPAARQPTPTGSLSRFHPLVRYVALRLKRQHPKWGPDVLLLKLRQRASLRGHKLPSRSALAAYLSPYLPRLQPARRVTVKRPTTATPVVNAPHVCWQMDFKGDERLGSCGSFAPFMVVDAYTSAPLETRLYPAGLKGVNGRTVQDNLRQVFTTWGLPDFIRMDRGSVFVGSTRLEWPSTLLLWLAGLGITPQINAAGRPTQNAQVERQNQTWLYHVAVGAAYPTVCWAQHATDTARYERLAWLPSRNRACGGRAPLQAQPDLCVPRRVYHPSQESRLFDWERVELYLSDWRWGRMVDKVGAISLADHNVYISNQHVGQAVEVTYDLALHRFVARACDLARIILRDFELSVITPQSIIGQVITPSDGG
jgi:hypothetical protein